MLASRWLRMDPRPSERAQEEPARARRRRLLPADRARSTWRMLGVRASHRGAGSWWCCCAWRRSVSMRAAGQERAQGLLAQERRGAVRDQRARARRDEPGGDRCSPPSAWRARCASWPEVRGDAGHHRRQQQKTPNLASIYVRLVPPDKRKLTQDQLQDSASAARSCPSSPRTTASTSRRFAAFGGGDVQHGDGAVHPDRAGPDQADAVLERDHQEAEGGPGRRRRRHHASCGKPEVVAVVEPAQGGRPGRQRRRRRGGVAAAWSAASRSRATRSRAASTTSWCAPTRQFRTSPEALALLTVPSSQLGAVPLLDVVDLKRARGPVEDQSATGASARSPSSPTPRPASATARSARRWRRSVKEMNLPAAISLRRRSGSRRRSSARARASSSPSGCRSSSCT